MLSGRMTRKYTPGELGIARPISGTTNGGTLAVAATTTTVEWTAVCEAQTPVRTP